MKINANDTVKFTLTAAGAKMYNARYDGLDIPATYSPAPKAAGDQVTEQLWSVMAALGPHIYLGMPEVPFEKCELEIENAETRVLQSQLADVTRERDTLRAMLELQNAKLDRVAAVIERSGK